MAKIDEKIFFLGQFKDRNKVLNCEIKANKDRIEQVHIRVLNIFFFKYNYNFFSNGS